jgi:hypothetical protein
MSLERRPGIINSIDHRFPRHRLSVDLLQISSNSRFGFSLRVHSRVIMEAIERDGLDRTSSSISDILPLLDDGSLTRNNELCASY